MHFRGKLYRALNPVYAREPLSGKGAALYGGRFNPKGTPALYTALSVMTAIRESNQIGHLQPTTLVSYEADMENIFDSRDEAALDAHQFSTAQLAAEDWRERMLLDGEAPIQTFARRLMDAGYHGLLVRSFARGAKPDDLNMVLWKWSADAPHRLRLIDDDGRLLR
ncbi:RES family NAD+ phosphorylase [Rhizobium sp. L1K21]|uniref:RES family NAD+ phosphorylase n=1 Tax=Rhizobium sp. L1K21 TaxID=2954933 RepID=UPI002093FEEB|nr:RES domain-containing protein [Rhizobium sp. L1K21]MCO6188274.1 RES domain-containing protein [Rhizobium sp. L1K21]